MYAAAPASQSAGSRIWVAKTGVVNRRFSSACLLLLATACGAETSVSVAQPGALSAKEWCAEYRQVLTNARFAVPESAAGTIPPAAQELPVPSQAEFLAILEKLRALADKSPAEIRDDLKAAWEVPPGLLPSAPPVMPSTPDEAGLQVAQRLERPMRWISENCGDQIPPDALSADRALLGTSRPIGDWQVVQSGKVGASRWTFFRTEASEGGECVAFESEPSNIDLNARIRAQAPPGVPVPPSPPFPPPSIPEGLGLSYKGKLPQCGPKPDLFERSDPVTFWVQEQDATNHYNVLAGSVVDSVRTLTITFEGGEQKVITPVDRTFVATYDAELRVTKVVPDLGPEAQVTCEPIPVDLSSIPDMTPAIPLPISLSCQGSYNRSRPRIPPFGRPRG
jgi:hypothetical protein